MVDIPVNKGDWDALTPKEQAEMNEIISNFFRGDKHNIVPDASKAAIPAFKNPLCTAACNIAEAAAVTACAIYSGPALAVCLTAAHEAGNYCRSRC